MLLWTGLGNPEPGMRRQRHNIGFMAVERIAEHYRFSPWRARFKGETAEGSIEGQKVLLLKPMTYMNLSGESVQQAARFFKIPVSDITAFHDELDLAFCKVRVKRGGGAAGHNGLRSMDRMLGDQNYQRVRLGIGHPGHKDRVTGHVLGDFAKAEQNELEELLDAVATASPLLAKGEPEATMTKIAMLVRGETLMGFNCGIVGLPNVGKSTLFNALTETAAAQAANYPFCTIEPNVGRVAVPDPRLDNLARIGKSQKILPTSLEFVDIAGLVRGASRGEGLGNQFLANIREVDAIIHVLRCFEDDDITHVEGGVDPVRDAEIIETELMLADLDSLEKRQVSLQKRARGNDREAQQQLTIMDPIIAALREGKPARTAVPKGEEETARRLQLMTTKPVLYVCNVEEGSAATGNSHSEAVRKRAEAEGAAMVVVSAAIEAEVSQLPQEERAEFLEGLGLSNSGLDRVIAAGYGLLGLSTYFTVGPKETRAWTITKGTKAPQAAAVIHNDFERGFIACETVAYDDYIACGGESGAKEAGKLRIEGKEYVVQDGDVLLFRFNV